MANSFPHVHAVILCGGSDNHLWPLSRELSPRPFMTVNGEDESLLAATAHRALPYTNQPIHIVTEVALADEVASHLLGQGVLTPQRIDVIAEPYPRGTTFAIALAAACICAEDPAAILLILPGAHHMVDDERWELAMGRAYRLACDDRFALIGTTPLNASVHHAYLRLGHPIKGIVGTYEVEDYLPHPTGSQAFRLAHENGLWDTGALMVRASLVLSELRRAGAERLTIDSEGGQRIAETAGFLAALGREHWYNDDAAHVVATLPNVSLEQAILDVTGYLAVVATSIEWSNVSSLAALDELTAADSAKNHVMGNGLAINTSETTVYADGARLVATLGLRDALVIDTPDALLVASKNSLSQLPDLMTALREVDAPELLRSCVRSRPWGTITALRREGAFSLERLEILPAHRTPPLRDARHRMELTVIAGFGSMRLDSHTRSLDVGESISVRSDVRTVITNTGDNPLVLICIKCDVQREAEDLQKEQKAQAVKSLRTESDGTVSTDVEKTEPTQIT